MFGGASPGESSASTRATTTTDSPRIGRPARIALVVTVVALAVTAALTSQWAPEELRQLLMITGGAMFFGAGLLQIATWRVTHQPLLCIRGFALAVPGLTVVFLSPVVAGWYDAADATSSMLPAWFAVAVLVAACSLVAFSVALARFLEAASGEEQRLSSAEIALHAATQAARSHNEEQRDLRHDARNALFALRMATQTLSEVGDRLDQETRQRLRVAVLNEVGTLDELISRSTAARIDVPGFAKKRQPLVPQQRPRRATDQEAVVVHR